MYVDMSDTARIREFILYWGPKVLVASLILLATYYIAKWVRAAFAKSVDKSPALRRTSRTAPDRTVGHQFGLIAQLLIWLVGLIAALQVMGLQQILQPVNGLVADIFAFLPKLIGAALLFFIGLIVARIARQLVETVLTEVNVDGMMARAGMGSLSDTRTPDPQAVPPGAAPATPRNTLAKAAGILVFAFIIIPVAIAALQVLGISAISRPATNMLNGILNAIPKVLSAAVWIGAAFIAGKFVKTVIEGVLPSTGFDSAVRSTGVLPASTVPSRIIANIVFFAILLAAAIEATKDLGGGTVSLLLTQITALGGKVIFGTAIIVAGVFLARLLANLIGSSTGEGSYVQTIVKYSIIALFTAIGLTFMGLANEIVILAFGLILGSAAVATALAFGLGGREAAGRLLSRYVDSAGSGSPPPPARPKRVTAQVRDPEGQPPLV